ncbi:ATP-sensitive inward rectifier potassium channel 11-like isoform X1 [Maniola hyperantus]|uniref:ATP-sensitive inward rectifier potassium channel 11-like isoform X1 n=2 Tax=Aphantopus hyperantus TaxID=2795564 RepID=UPI0015695AA6|nr:ATP-sensitive inward rectifier potassium channel 11-like [Maniola hyperantus]
MDNETPNDLEFEQINQLYDECLHYLKTVKSDNFMYEDELKKDEDPDPGYETIAEIKEKIQNKDMNSVYAVPKSLDLVPNIGFKVENEMFSSGSITSISSVIKSERLRRLSQQLPKIIITQSNTSLSIRKGENEKILQNHIHVGLKTEQKIENQKIIPPKPSKKCESIKRTEPAFRYKAYGDFPKRLVSKNGIENVALISNVPFEKIRLMNDTFHTLINLRWRWIVIGTVIVHFAIWLVFAVFWYISALAHYDFEPEPPQRSCVTGGKDFVTIFLASVEAQTTIGFGDRAIDEECPESIFLFIMQLILGTGLSGVLTCVVYAKLTRPEKLSRDGVGFSKKAVISMRDGRLCLMIRAWDLNYDHIISSEFTAHFVNTHRTKESEVIRYYARSLPLQQRQFLLWPVILVHEIDATSPLYRLSPRNITENSYEITISLKGASASMGTFTQSQTSYLPKEVVWGHRFPPVVMYDKHRQKYVIDHWKLDIIEPVDTPNCSAHELYSISGSSEEKMERPGTPGSFSDRVSTFQIERISSFKRKDKKI